MRILIACEFSGKVRDAFIRKGHETISCDILPSDTVGPHYQGDVFDILFDGWDMLIAFPPCTHLAVSGARWFKDKYHEQRHATAFFMQLAYAPVPKICIENPVGIMSSRWKKPDQYVQPWQYGHPESKKTGLWLKNLSPLVPTNILELPKRGYWENQYPNKQNNLWGKKDAAKLRGITYSGIAEAMANQWG